MGLSDEFVSSDLGRSRAFAELVVAAVQVCMSAVEVGRRYLGQTQREAVALAKPTVLEKALIEAGYRPSTADKYARCTMRFLASAGESESGRLQQGHVLDHLRDLADAGVGGGALRVHLCAVRCVFDRLMGVRLTAGIPLAPRPSPRPPATQEMVEMLMRACDTSEERAAMDLLYETRLMPGKLCRLAADGPPKAVAPCAKALWRRSGCRTAVQALQVAEEGDAGTRWCFPSRIRPGPISTRTLRRVVSRVAAACGLRITCTAIRKAGEERLRRSA